jgi:regulator of CtrA degradation
VAWPLLGHFVVTAPFVMVCAGGELCHHIAMTGLNREPRMQHRLTDTLYGEAMALADEARAYFDEAGRTDRETLAPSLRVRFSCESLKVTTRLMHVIAWLLTQRAVQAGDLPASAALDPSRRLGEAPVTDAVLVGLLPTRARAIVQSSTDLHRRVATLDLAQIERPEALFSPALSMQHRLAVALQANAVG